MDNRRKNKYDIKPQDCDRDEFNKIYEHYLRQQYKLEELTDSGGLKQGRQVEPNTYSIDSDKKSITLFIRDYTGTKAYKWTGKNAEKTSPNKITPRQAFYLFRRKCQEYGVYIENYSVDNGEYIKENEIEQAKIWCREGDIDQIYSSVYHLDFHSSYPSGLALTHPEFRPIIEELYEKRKIKPEYKDVLNYTIGWMQSKHCGFKYSNLARDAINNNNERIDKMTKKLKADGLYPVLYNTDGIWYIGDHEYHGEGEGDGIGQWHNDYVNVQKFRIKSRGCYEFIDEQGQYHVKMRGYSKLDDIKPRDQWEWGDIYKVEAQPKKITFEPGYGLKEVDDHGE